MTTNECYIDMHMTNIEQNSSTERVKTEFKQLSSQVLIKDTTNYKLSIIRFVLNSEGLPIFIPTMQSATDKVNTTYSITMEYNGQYYQQYMLYEPQISNPVDEDEYYYVLTYQWLIYLINKCIKSCVNGLNAKTLLNSSYPKMVYDINTKMCSISIDSNEYGYNETNKINIYMNYAMYAMFTSLSSCVANKNINGMDIQLNNMEENIITQEYSTIGLWNPISSIVLTSNLLPIVSSISNPVQIIKNGSQINGSSSYNFSNTVTDFTGNDLLFTPFIQYDASVYRFISLKDHQRIQNIDTQVEWINKLTGKSNPVYIAPNGFSSIKILLTREE